MFFKKILEKIFKKREKPKITTQRISPNEVKIIYKEGDIHNEVVARVATRGSYEPWSQSLMERQKL